MFSSSIGSADLGQNSRSPALVDFPVTLPACSRSEVWNNPGDYFSPIIEQHDAFAILKGRADQDIWNYVNLSDEELTAIIKLRLFVRSTGNRNGHVSSRTSLQSNVSSLSTSSRGRATSNSVARSSVTSTESIPSNRQLVGGKKTLRHSFGQQAALLELAPEEKGTHPAAKPQCSYWCTVCDARSYETSSGWIKHEKERHEQTVYVCMPDGPTSNTENGSVCVLCGARNPDAKHLEAHNIAPCLSRSLTARTYTRLYQLQKHLETHNILKGSSVASRWRRDYNKQAWACGFCVAYFAKAKDRFYHIAKQHYERGEDISQWDPSKVILGLLQQPKVHKAWTKRLKLEFPAGEIDLRWDRTPSRSLITMLELGVRGNEDGADLATAAFTQSDYCQSRFDSQYTAITPVEGTERGIPISRRELQDLHQLDHNSHNSEPNQIKSSNLVNPIFLGPGWPHPPGDHLPQATDVRTEQHLKALPELPTFDPNQIDMYHLPQATDARTEQHLKALPELPTFDPNQIDMFHLSSYKIQPSSHPEQSTWPDQILFGVDSTSRCELENTVSTLSYLAEPLFGECVGGQLIHAPIGDAGAGRKPHQESLHINGRRSISPSSQNKRLVSKFSTHRSASPMELDQDPESFGGVLGNEETILEAQLNLWDQNMYLK